MVKSKAISALLSVVIALGLWLYVITFVSPESEATYVNIPVHFRGENILHERGYMVVTEELPTVSMTLSGKRTDLNNINSSNITLIADLSTIDSAGIQSVFYSYSFPGNVADNAITVLEQTGKIELEIEHRSTKEIPVNLKYKNDVPEDFVADKEKAELDHEKVTISGPEPVIKRITQAIVEVDLEGRKSSFMEAQRFTLCDATGDPVDSAFVETNVGQVSLTLKIQRVKELTLDFDIIDGGGATKNNCKIKYEPETIKVSGPDAVLAGIEDILVIGEIDLAEVLKSGELKFPITLSPSITNVSGVEEVTVTITLPELATRTFTVTNFVRENVPSAMYAQIDTRVLTVTVRGPRDQINNLRDTDISVHVDFSEAKVGNDQIKPVIVVSEYFPDVGAVGTYSVSTTMRQR